MPLLLRRFALEILERLDGKEIQHKTHGAHRNCVCAHEGLSAAKHEYTQQRQTDECVHQITFRQMGVVVVSEY